MFIIKKEAVETCKLQIKDTVVSGVKYLNCVFIPGEVYEKRQKKEAIQRAREFLDNGQFCIIIEDFNSYRLWHVAPVESTIFSETVQVKETHLEPEFLAHCQRELARYIGPMAKLVCEEILNNASSSFTPQDYIQALAREIPNQQQANQFLKTLGENN